MENITEDASSPELAVPPVRKGGRPKIHASDAERKRKARAAAKAAQKVPARKPRVRIHGTNASRQRAYRVRKAKLQPGRVFAQRIEPPAPGTGTKSDWNRYLKAAGLDMKQGLFVTDAPSHAGELRYSGGITDIEAIDTGHQHGANAEGCIARRVAPTGAGPSGDECEEVFEDNND